MKPIVCVPHDVLTTPAKLVQVFDKKLAATIRDMKATLAATRNPKGVGLAAPQVGVSLQIFLTKPTATTPVRVFINPDIIRISSTRTAGVPAPDRKLEGCLSIPRIWGKVARATSLTLRYQDEHGAQHEEAFDGFVATIIQHETDHINGILFTQRVLEQKGKLYQTTKDTAGKETLEEISLK